MATTVSVSSIRCSLFSLNTNTLQPSLSNNISFSKKTHFSSVRRTKITHTSVITGVSAQPHSVISCLESKLSESVIKEAGIDIQLPRRSLMVKFTCNSCGQRTERMVNRLAYERGTVFVQITYCSWLPPPRNVWQLSTNGSYCDQHGGYGALLRNNKGELLYAYNGTEGPVSVTYNEMMAIYKGLLWLLSRELLYAYNGTVEPVSVTYNEMMTIYKGLLWLLSRELQGFGWLLILALCELVIYPNTVPTDLRVLLDRDVVCAGCLKHHKLVDNLGLVVEYDLRDTELNAVEE
ncbi:hypothetical protein GIB67_041926 [Kingdonia uniflora]|uniref:DNL-type domain-containing protein n=1 Tax=Kingdonia uniflora TaxID=39325 RepID=A0A7J7N1I9_9MAGN|nr:hypothetical protein GIB67_041926 [Kingdonia uniflora]